MATLLGRRSRSTALRRRTGRVTALGAASVLVLSACGPGGSGGSGALGFEDVESGVIQIEAVGTFEEPGEGAFEAAGRGSGFIVDPSGLAVTNNHVVVGAGTLKVWLNGDELSARILGSSECLDLAVIDLEGDDYPYLEWFDGEIKGAQEVWSLGFPLGDPTFTITGGIVSKDDTPTDTEWAALDHTIEHDARIRGGNSGGPLINEDGRVVGVNYAGDEENDINLAIHRDEVQKVLSRLVAGEYVLSLGINGRAWVSEDGSASGIFVSSIASGSPADEAGITPGDLITKMEGVTLATDGTMADYCAVLKTHGEDDTLTVEVYRPSDGGVYTGQVNGKPLEAASLPTSDDDAPPTTGGGDGGAATGDLVTVTDDSERISVQVPASWTDVDGRQFTDDKGNVVYDVTVSSSIADFNTGWSVSGLAVSASSDAVENTTVDEILDAAAGPPQSSGCTLDTGARQAYSDALYSGSYDWWTGCGGVGSDYVVIAATADDGSHLIWVKLQIAEGDGWVLEPIVGSFQAAF
jgi:serine protease Do